MGGPPVDVAGKVKGPAIFMMVAMGIGIAWALLNVVLNILGTGLVAADAANAGDEAAMVNMMSGTVAVIFGLISIAVGGFVIFACTKMMKLESWGLALTAMILGLLPCVSPCCLLGLGAGIWGLVVLNDANVKASFR